MEENSAAGEDTHSFSAYYRLLRKQRAFRVLMLGEVCVQ